MTSTQVESLEPRTLLTGSTIDVTTSADSGSGSLREAIIEANSLPSQTPVSIVFSLSTSDPGYNATTGVWTLSVASSLPAITDSPVTIDSSLNAVDVPGGLTIEGGTSSNSTLSFIGDGQDNAVDLPDPATVGNGVLVDGGLAISYSGQTGLTVSNLASLTLETPNSGNQLNVASPASGQNQVNGSSGGVAMAPLTFSDVASVSINTAANDGANPADSIVLQSSGLVASELANFVVQTGASSNLTILAPTLALPDSGGTFVDEAGSGYNTVVADADVNYSLTSNVLAIPGSGSLVLQNVQDVQLAGGPDSTSFAINGWTGDLGLNGGSGSNSLVFNDAGSYSGSLTLTSFAGTSIQIGGNFFGSIDASVATSINQLLIDGDDEPGSSITAGAFVPAANAVLPAVEVEGNFGGSLTAQVSASVAGSGELVSMDVRGDLLATAGTITAGLIGTLTFGGDLDGQVTATGVPDNPTGISAIGSVTIDGNLNGNLSAPENLNPGSGVIGTVTIEGSLNGELSGGRLSVPSIGKALNGVIVESGAGYIGNLTVGGDLTGQVIAVYDPNSSISAEIASITVGGTLTGTVSAVRQIGTVVVNSVGTTGSIDAGNVASFVGSETIGGTVALGSVNSLTVGTLTGCVNLGAAGSVAYQAMMSGSEIDASSITSLVISGALAGTVNVTGDLGSVLVGQNFSGEIEVGGTLGSLAVTGSTPGTVIAGHVGTISATAATGPFVLQVEDNGVERQVLASIPSIPFPTLSQAQSASPAGTTFSYYYESGGLSNPQLTIQVDNQSGSKSPDQFDLSLVTDNSAAKFNLARLDSVGISGIGDVSVEGDILTTLTRPAKAFFGADPNKAGVQLPLDNLESVGVRDDIPFGGYINAASIQGLSAGLIGLSWGPTIPGVYASAYEVQSLLSNSTKVVEANGTFRVPFTGSSTYQVGFFMDDSTSGQFDWSDVGFTIENQVAYNPAVSTKANTVTISNASRGADIALIQVGLPSPSSGSRIDGITIRGDGASLATFQWIDGPIISSGPLGDLFLLNSNPVQSITAPSIFGTITSFAPYVGTIETTGLWTDPVSGAVSDIPADFGRTYLNAWNQLVTTTFETYSGTFSGSLIVRGTLVSNVVLNGGLTGTIAAQGNIGTTLSNLTLGGITDNGNDTGSILSLGQIVGPLTIYGNLGKTGSIVASKGILGSTTITGNLGANARIVSGGSIGSTTLGTELTIYGNINGVIAAEGLVFQWPYNINSSNTIQNAGATGSANGVLIDEVLAGCSSSTSPLISLGSASCCLDLDGYDDLMTILAELYLVKPGQLVLK